MQSTGKHRRSKRGVGSIIGATFLALILLSGFTFYAVILNITDHYNETLGSMGETDWDRSREETVINSVRTTATKKLNLTVENKGPIQSRLIWLGIINKSVTPESQAYYSLSEYVGPGETKSIVSSFSVQLGKKYAVQLVTELGNVIENRFYPASAVHCALTLTVAPPTAYVGNNVTVFLTVSHNDTEVDTIQSLAVTLQPSPSGLVQLKTNSPLSVEGLRKGESAFFWWVYGTVSTGTVTFNASYSQAPAGTYTLSSANIASAPSGGAGTVTITGVNCTVPYNPSQWSPVGSTQYVSGSVSDLANDDGGYAVFRSYSSVMGTDIKDFVDNTSNVDGSSDKGTHSDFAAQKYGPDSILDTLTEAIGSGSSTAYYPAGYNLMGSSQYVSGVLANLQVDDGAYMVFRGSQSATSGQPFYAHSETTTIGGSPYYLHKLTSADGTATSLSASMGSAGRQLWGKFVYPLTGLGSIPGSTWTMYYRASRDAGPSITFDRASSLPSSGAVTSFSWSHTTGSGSNRLMIVGVSIRDTTVSVSSITYGAQSLTYIRGDTHASATIRSELWYLIAPASGTATVTVNLSGSTRAVGGACTYAGVAQTAPVDASNGGTGSSQTPSRSITVNTAGSWLLGHIAIFGSSATVSSEGSGQTYRWDSYTSTGAEASRCRGHGSNKGPVSAGSQSMSWGLSATVDWAVSVAAFRPAAPVGHADADILIRQSSGVIRTTIATNVATSGDLISSVATLSGTYAWAAYTVVDQTDYLEIDYYVDVTTTTAGVNAYLRIDDSALAIGDQTRTTNVMLPSEYTVEVEFSGASNTESWMQLVWTIDSSFTTAGVTATFQLFNYTANAYATSGNGYLTDTIGTTDVTKTQTITTNPTHFRNATGYWKMKVKGVGMTGTQFDWRGDLVKYEPSSVTYELDLEVQWISVDFSQANEWLCIYGGTMATEDVRVDVWTGGAWANVFTDLSSGWNNISVSSYLTSATFTIRFRDGTPVGDGTQSSWNIDVSLLHLWNTTTSYVAEVEFTGSSNLQTWTSLLWQIDSAWDVAQVTVMIQFYNFTLGGYATSGNGYLNYVSNATPNTNELKTQTISANPTHFRNSTGHWKVKIKGVKSTVPQFLMKVDWIDYETSYSSSGTTVPYKAWHWYAIKATTSDGSPVPYYYISIYANGTNVAFRDALSKTSVANPAWVRLNAVGEYYLEMRSTNPTAQIFVLSVAAGSVVGQKTITQGAPS